MSHLLAQVVLAGREETGRRAFGILLERLCAFKRRTACVELDSGVLRLATAPNGQGVAPALVQGDDGIWLVALGTPLPRASQAWDSAEQLASYRRHGVEPLARSLQGQFALVIGDPSAGAVHVLTDRCGSLHLFLAERDGAVFVSTSSAVLGEAQALDPGGVHEFVATGIVYEERTLWEGVRKLAPATVTTIDRHGVTQQRYWRLADLDLESLSADQAADALQAGLSDVLRRLPGEGPPPVADLTGGYDSRLLLCGLLAAGQPFATTVSGPAESADVRVAGGIARELGLAHGHVPPGPSPDWERFDCALRMTDGEYDAFDYARILYTHRQLSRRYRMSLNGSFGELARGYWWELLWPRLGRVAPIDARLVAARRFAATPYDTTLFSSQGRLPLVEHMAAVASRVLSSASGLPNTAQMDWLYYSMRMHRWHGRIASSTNQLWPSVSPLSFAQVLDPILMARHEARFRSLLARTVFSRHAPRLAAIPLEHGHPPAPASLLNWWRFSPLAGHYGRRVWGKLRPRLGLATAEAEPPPRLRTRYASLFAGSPLADWLADPVLAHTGLFEPQRLAAFLSPDRSHAGARLEQWCRLVTLECTLRTRAEPPARSLAERRDCAAAHQDAGPSTRRSQISRQ